MNNTIDFKRLQKIVNEEVKRYMKLHESGTEGDQKGNEESPIQTFARFVDVTAPLHAAIEKFEKDCPDKFKGTLPIENFKKEIENGLFNQDIRASIPKNQVNAVPDLRTPVQGQNNRRR